MINSFKKSKITKLSLTKYVNLKYITKCLTNQIISGQFSFTWNLPRVSTENVSPKMTQVINLSYIPMLFFLQQANHVVVRANLLDLSLPKMDANMWNSWTWQFNPSKIKLNQDESLNSNSFLLVECHFPLQFHHST